MNIEFPENLQHRFGTPWVDTDQVPMDWFHDNFMRFVYPADHVLSSAVEYDYKDGPGDSGVYFLIHSGRVVYVGKAACIYQRLLQHFESGKRFTHYWCFGGVPASFLEYVEAFYINYLRPPLNVARGRGDLFVYEHAQKALNGMLFKRDSDDSSD
jgi:hypothetical protein